MPNPWQATALDWCRNIIRFTIWMALTLNLLMVSVFAIAITFRLLVHLWGWMGRTVFKSPW